MNLAKIISSFHSTNAHLLHEAHSDHEITLNIIQTLFKDFDSGEVWDPIK